MKRILSIILCLLLVGCSSSTDSGADSSSKKEATTTTSITTTDTSTTQSTTTTSATTTSVTTTTTTTRSTTTVTTTTFDKSYTTYNRETKVQALSQCTLYEAPDLKSKAQYNFDAMTIFVAVGETPDFIAVRMNNDVSFVPRTSIHFYHENVNNPEATVAPTMTVTQTEYIDDYQEPTTQVTTEDIFDKTYYTIDAPGSWLDMTFHREGCKYLFDEPPANAIITIFNCQTYQHMLELHFSPCPECNPT